MSGSTTSRPRRRYSFPQSPQRVYWEITRACPLACAYCPVGAVPSRHPRELTTEEGKGLLEEIRSFSDLPPELVLTGGDPLCREDLGELVAHASQLGLKVTLWLSPTGHLTASKMQVLHAAGAQTIALSVDDTSPENHDKRHMPGSFARTVQAAEAARELGLKLHVNTLVTDDSLVEVPHIYETVRGVALDQWNLFFLVRMGGGKRLTPISAWQAEVLMNWLYETAREAPFPIQVMEAPHYRRIVFQRLREEGVPLSEIAKTHEAAEFGLRDGNGILFVSHVGDVYPGPFLPLVTGNVRGKSLTALYRRSRPFRELRDPARIKGDCGRCQFRRICGGSRARAYAETGDWSARDPLCAYHPIGIHSAY